MCDDLKGSLHTEERAPRIEANRENTALAKLIIILMIFERTIN